MEVFWLHQGDQQLVRVPLVTFVLFFGTSCLLIWGPSQLGRLSKTNPKLKFSVCVCVWFYCLYLSCYMFSVFCLWFYMRSFNIKRIYFICNINKITIAIFRTTVNWTALFCIIFLSDSSCDLISLLLSLFCHVYYYQNHLFGLFTPINKFTKIPLDNNQGNLEERSQ